LAEELLMKYVVYEVWTKSRVIEAEDTTDAFKKGEPLPIEDMSLCNWHVVPVPAEDKE
jgi:hypothetical protein